MPPLNLVKRSNTAPSPLDVRANTVPPSREIYYYPLLVMTANTALDSF